MEMSRDDDGVWPVLRGAEVRVPNASPNSRVDSRSNKCNVITPKLTGYEFWDDDKAKKFAVWCVATRRWISKGF
jgi:hypothetical protein